MRAGARLKRLERKFDAESKIWTVFTIAHFEDPLQRTAVQQRLVEDYMAEGNHAPPIAYL